MEEEAEGVEGRKRRRKSEMEIGILLFFFFSFSRPFIIASFIIVLFGLAVDLLIASISTSNEAHKRVRRKVMIIIKALIGFNGIYAFFLSIYYIKIYDYSINGRKLCSPEK